MADEGIYYAGRPLLLDCDAQIANFLGQWLNPVSACTPSHQVDDRRDSRGEDPRVGVNLPRLNYPPRPTLELNQLYWPTGATRWAEGCFLATEEDANYFRRRAYGPFESWNNDLDFTVVYNGSILTTRLFMLAPQPVTSITGDRLFLIRLVDTRYWWQSIGLGAYPRVGVGSSPLELSRSGIWKSWDTVIGACSNALKETFVWTGPFPEYLKPDPVELSRHFDNAAALLDAVAHSIGRRVVRSLGGGTDLETFEEARKQRDRALQRVNGQIAGDTWKSHPDTSRLLIAFPKVISGHLDCNRFHWFDIPHRDAPGDDGQSQVLTDNAGNPLTDASGQPLTVGGSQGEPEFVTIDPTCNTYDQAVNPHNESGRVGVSDVIFTTLHASFPDAQTPCPSNQGTLETFAEKVYKDYFGWRESDGMDVTYAGVVRWLINGLDDFVLFDLGTEVHTGQSIESPEDGPSRLVDNYARKLTTRVRSLPQEFGARHQWSQDETVVVVEEPWFQLTQQGKMDPGTAGLCSLVNVNSSGVASFHSPPLSVSVYDLQGQVFATPGEVIRGRWSCDRQRWETAEEYGLSRYGVANADIISGASGPVKVYRSTNPSCTGSESGVQITACAKQSISSMAPVLIEFIRSMRMWFAKPYAVGSAPAPAAPIVYGECINGQDLFPGVVTGKQFNLLSRQGGNWVPSDPVVTVTVIDTANANCVLAGEQLPLWTPNGQEYLPTAESGLRRLFIADEDIQCGGSGNATMLLSGFTTGVVVNVFNTFPGHHRKISLGYNDVFWCDYDKTWSRWVINPQPIAMFATGTLDGTLSPGQTVPPITNFALLDFKNHACSDGVAPSPLEIANTFKHAGPSGARVLLMRHITGATLNQWVIIDVEKVATNVARKLRIDETQTPAQVQLNIRQAWIEAPVIVDNWQNQEEARPCDEEEQTGP